MFLLFVPLSLQLTENAIVSFFDYSRDQFQVSEAARNVLKKKMDHFEKISRGLMLSLRLNGEYFSNFSQISDWTKVKMILRYVYCSEEKDEDFLLAMEEKGCHGGNKTTLVLQRVFPSLKNGVYDISPRINLLSRSKPSRDFLNKRIWNMNQIFKETYYTLEQNGMDIANANDVVVWKNITLNWKLFFCRSKFRSYKVNEIILVLDSKHQEECLINEQKSLIARLFPKITVSSTIDKKLSILNESSVAKYHLERRMNEFNLDLSLRASVVLEKNSRFFSSVQDITDWTNVSLFFENDTNIRNLELLKFFQFLETGSGSFVIDGSLSKLINYPPICRRVQRSLKMLRSDSFYILDEGMYFGKRCWIERYTTLEIVQFDSKIDSLNEQINMYQNLFSFFVSARNALLFVFKQSFLSLNSFYYLTNCNGDPMENASCEWNTFFQVKQFVFGNYQNTMFSSFFYIHSLSDANFSDFKPETFRVMIKRFCRSSPNLVDVLKTDTLPGLSKFFSKAMIALGHHYFKTEVIQTFEALTNSNLKELIKKRSCHYRFRDFVICHSKEVFTNKMKI